VDLETTVGVSETIDGWMTRSELAWLFQTARALAPGSTWVELGSWKGRSFFAVAMGLPVRSRLVAVDSFTRGTVELPTVPTRDWLWDHFQAVLRGVQKLRTDLVLSVIRSDTASASQGFADRSVDAVFIDGDHTREGLRRDLEAWMPKAKPGGLLCGHDYSPGFPGVMTLIDEWFPDRLVVADTSIWVAAVPEGASCPRPDIPT
jgi:hypothetical protein